MATAKRRIGTQKETKAQPKRVTHSKRTERTPATAARVSSESLFDSLGDEASLDPRFVTLRDERASQAARWMLDDVFHEFTDPDGNFVEQFQTTGFDARVFELYLFAYFSRSEGYTVDRTRPNPDFIVERDGLRVAVEATTTNSSQSGPLAALGTHLPSLSPEEMLNHVANELPIRFGSALLSKLKKQYWKKAHCRDMPMVFAVEAFHGIQSLHTGAGALTRLLFGLDQTASKAGDELRIDAHAVASHRVTNKEIPSAFFSQKDAEHVSAVVFTNAGTTAKFSRIGYQHGAGCDELEILRVGKAYCPEQNAATATYFEYGLGDPPRVERWGEGLVVLHNPHALRPLPRDFFVDAVQTYLVNGALRTDYAGWHPFNSASKITWLPPKMIDGIRALRSMQIEISEIATSFAHALCPLRCSVPTVREDTWFADHTGAFLGVVTRDGSDDTWGYTVFGLDSRFSHRVVLDQGSQCKDRWTVIDALHEAIADRLKYPKRVFSTARPKS